MIAHTTAFATLAQAPIKRTNVQVAQQQQDPYGYSDSGTTWQSGDLLMQVNIDCVGQFLGTVTKKATVKLMGIQTVAVNSSTTPSIWQIRLGLYNADPSVVGFDYVSEGFYLVDNVTYDYDAGFTTVTMYDHMWFASQTQWANFATYPISLTDFATGLASALGLALDPNFSTLPNASFMITQDLYANISNATFQTVIQEVAASTGTIARVTDNTLMFKPFQILSENLDSNTLKNLTLGNSYGPVTSVILGRVPQNDNIALINPSSSSQFITAIDTSANTFTITGNNMTDGTLVQIQSDGTLPAPLLPNTNYYVWTNGSANTFKLSDTYLHALAGTNIIDITSAGSGTISLTQLKTQEVQINNVQILDNDRETLLPPLYNALLGDGWTESKSNTIGLPWHEVGDVIQFTQGSKTVPSLLSEVHLTLAGSIQESLVSVIPDVTSINYLTAGGVLKTLYDTEIKVDKQNQSITSIVSQQQVYADQTLQSFTAVNQRIDNVTTQIQSVGGGNLLLNSVGYAKETDGSLSFWTKTGTGTVTAYSSAGSLSAGGTSGNTIQLIGASPQIVQRISVANTGTYSIGFRVNKLLGDGGGSVTLSNAVTSFTIPISSGTGYVWQELKLEGITPGQPYWDVTVKATSTTTSIEITDLRVMTGPTLVSWTQSQSEILNTTVALTTQGIRVSSSVYNGDYTVMTPLEFAGYTNVSGTSQKVFWVNRDTTQVNTLQVDKLATFGGVMRAIPVGTGPIAGLSFVGNVS